MIINLPSLSLAEKNFIISFITDLSCYNNSIIPLSLSKDNLNLCKSLNQKSLYIYDDNKEFFSYFVPCFYIADNKINIFIDNSIYKYLKIISFYYTKGIDIFEFNNIYTFDFLNLLNQYTNFTTSNFKINIIDFRRNLNISDNEYKAFSNFKRRVIEPLVSKFNMFCSNMVLDISYYKESYKSNDIYITFSLKVNKF